MKAYLNKITVFFFAMALIFVACEDDDTLVITEPEPAFLLEQSSASNINLNFGLPDNPALTITWSDEITGSSSYSVEMAIDEDFTSPISLGSSSTNSFSMTVSELNAAINSSGTEEFDNLSVYMRVAAGSQLSNAVVYTVTAYPLDGAILTSPTEGDSFVLSLASADDVVLTASWDDALPSASGSTDYRVEIASTGTEFASPATVGSGSDIFTVSVTHSELNAAALSIGVAPDTEANVDMRVVATTVNTNGVVLERAGEEIVISITPYQAIFPYLYLVGDATTPGWNNNNNNTAVFRSQDTPNSYYYTGYFSTGGFKMLEMKGSWHPQWGDRNNSGTLGVSNPDGSNEAGTFGISTAGYYTMTVSSLTEGAAYTITPFDAANSPTYDRIGLIGQAIGGWGDGDEIDLTQDPNNPHLWYALSVSFTNGEQFLIRPNDDWNNGVWRYTGSQELFGQANFATSGENFPFNADSGTYDFWFNDLDGSYVIIPN